MSRFNLNLSNSLKIGLLKGTIVALLAGGAIMTPDSARAVPGLSSSDSVKKIVDMVKVYAKSNQRVNAYDIEKQLRDRPRAATDALVDLLDTTDPKVQYEAANILRRLSNHSEYSISSETLKTVIAILKATENPKVKAALLTVLGNIGPKNETVKLAILETVKGDFEVNTKKTAIEALAKLSMQEKPQFHLQSTEVLIKILREDDAPALRKAAASALSRYHNDSKLAVPALISALDDNYLTVRTAAVQALGKYQKNATAAIPALLKMVDTESNTSIRTGCIYSLKTIGNNDERVVTKFIELLDDPSMNRNVLSYMYYFGDRMAPAIPKLIVFLKDSDRYQRQNACRALGAIGAKAKEALPALKEAAKDADYSVSSNAKAAIRKISSKSSPTGRM